METRMAEWVDAIITVIALLILAKIVWCIDEVS